MKKTRRNFMKSALALGVLPLALVAEDKTKKEEEDRTLRFIHITDSHMDLQDEESVEAMENMVTFVNKEYKNLDFVLFGGDNFNNNVKGDKDALEFKRIISKLHCPTLVVRGNKESSPKPDDSIKLDEFKKLFLDNKLLTIEGKNNGLYTKETIDFADKILKKGKPTIVLNHHPYTNYWNEKDEKLIHKYVLNNSEEVQKKLFSYKNLILTLSGHKHIDSVTKIQDVDVIVTRGFVRPLDLDQYPMRYVEILDNKINQKLIYTKEV